MRELYYFFMPSLSNPVGGCELCVDAEVGV
jgi:hypothetical protein